MKIYGYYTRPESSSLSFWVDMPLEKAPPLWIFAGEIEIDESVLRPFDTSEAVDMWSAEQEKIRAKMTAEINSIEEIKKNLLALPAA